MKASTLLGSTLVAGLLFSTAGLASDRGEHHRRHDRQAHDGRWDNRDDRHGYREHRGRADHWQRHHHGHHHHRHHYPRYYYHGPYYYPRYSYYDYGYPYRYSDGFDGSLTVTVPLY